MALKIVITKGSSPNTMRCVAGEPIIFNYHVVGVDGKPQSLSGRRFVFAVYGPGRTEVGYFDAQPTIDSRGDIAAWEIDGTFSEDCFGQSLKGEISERGSKGRDPIVSFAFAVDESAPRISNLNTAPAGRYVTRITRVDDPANSPTPDFTVTYVALDSLPSTTLDGPITITGAAIVGQTLAVSIPQVFNGTVTGRQWLRGGVEIDGAVAETYALTLSDGGQQIGFRLKIAGPGGVVTVIVNVDQIVVRPTVAISAPISQSEGNSGTVAVTYTVTRSYSVGAVDVPWSFAPGTTDSSDYFGNTIPGGGLITIADGQTTGTLTVQVAGDTVVEPDEVATVSIAAPTGYVAGSRMSSTLTILNDDTAPLPTVTLSPPISQSEGNSGSTAFTFTVSRSTGAGAVTIPWSFAGGSTDATDYTGGVLPTGGNVMIADGQTTGNITIQVVGDTLVEPDEAATVTISVPSGYAAGARLSSTLTITNDDAAVPTMPGNANVALFAQDAATFGVVKNRAETLALPTSVWGNPRPGLNPLMATPLAPSGGSIARNGAGADGAAVALRMTWGAGEKPNFFFMGLDNSPLFRGARRLAAGTYTLSFDYKSANNNPQTMRLTNEAGLGSPPDLTIAGDGTWRTFDWTFTISNESILRNRMDFPTATTAGDVLVDNIRLVPGSTRGAVPPGDRHIVRVGRFPLVGQAIRTTAGGANGSEGHSWAARASDGFAANVSAFTFATALKMDANADLSVVMLLRGDEDAIQVGLTGGQFTMYSSTGGMNNSGCAGPDGAGWTTLIARGDANGCDLYMDGVRMGSSTSPFGGSVAQWQLFHRAAQYGFPGAVASAHVYDRRLSDADVSAAHAAMAAQIAAIGETYVQPAQSIIIDGDSNTSGDSYITPTARSFGKRLQVRNYAVASATLGERSQVGTGANTIWGRAHLVSAQIAHAKALGREPVLIAHIGTNDKNRWDTPAAGTAYATAHEEYWTYMRGLGAKVVASTMTAYQNITASEAAGRDAFCASIRDRYAAGKCDALADYAASPVGTWNSTHYYDIVHVTPAGRQVMASVLKPVLAPLLPDRA